MVGYDTTIMWVRRYPTRNKNSRAIQVLKLTIETRNNACHRIDENSTYTLRHLHKIYVYIRQIDASKLYSSDWDHR